MKNDRLLPHRILMTDGARGINPLAQLAQLTRGDALIFRHYELEKNTRHKLARQIADQCRQQSVRLLIAADWQLAFNIKADGLHLPGWCWRRGYNWKNRPRPNWLITGAAHSVHDLIELEKQEVDAALLSPAFPTPSHPNTKTLGVIRLADASQKTRLPFYALGGINEKALQRLKGVKLAGRAGVSPR